MDIEVTGMVAAVMNAFASNLFYITKLVLWRRLLISLLITTNQVQLTKFALSARLREVETLAYSEGQVKLT